jgi:hypothetical protein
MSHFPLGTVYTSAAYPVWLTIPIAWLPTLRELTSARAAPPDVCYEGAGRNGTEFPFAVGLAESPNPVMLVVLAGIRNNTSDF